MEECIPLLDNSRYISFAHPPPHTGGQAGVDSPLRFTDSIGYYDPLPKSTAGCIDPSTVASMEGFNEIKIGTIRRDTIFWSPIKVGRSSCRQDTRNDRSSRNPPPGKTRSRDGRCATSCRLSVSTSRKTPSSSYNASPLLMPSLPPLLKRIALPGGASAGEDARHPLFCSGHFSLEFSPNGAVPNVR